MTIRADSYSSTGEVVAYTRHLLDGASTFNSTTRPPATDVERFIDRASGALNTALAGAGLTTPITNSTAKLLCDDWVTARAAVYVELTQRGTGYSDAEGSRIGALKGLYDDAQKFAKDNFLSMVRIGVGVSHQMSEGLTFTGLDAVSERADPDDTTIEQPIFTRALHDFDTPDRDDDE